MEKILIRIVREEGFIKLCSSESVVKDITISDKDKKISTYDMYNLLNFKYGYDYEIIVDNKVKSDLGDKHYIEHVRNLILKIVESLKNYSEKTEISGEVN